MVNAKEWFGKRQGIIGRGIGLFERMGLFIVLAATLVAGTEELLRMFRVGQVGIPDLLLLFMYLEIVSMVETYWRMGKLPVRMPLYIAIVGIARHLMADPAHQSPWQLVSGAAAAVLLAIAVLIVRYGHTRYPYEESDHG
ncbi:MAG TPA: phosphate-starvation-inducible PsiE family protein [Patescibacteria group bacterium]|nr:phosphate-starvation-inducible PsiE family protein [Patescibacteria group bacterium]